MSDSTLPDPASRSWLWQCWSLCESSIGYDWPMLVKEWRGKSHSLRDYHRDRWAQIMAARIYRADPKIRLRRSIVLGVLTADHFAHLVERDRKPFPLSPVDEYIQSDGD